MTTTAVTRSADRTTNDNQSISVKDLITPASAAALATGLFGIGAMTNPGGALRMLYPSSTSAASATTNKDGNVRIVQQHIIVELWFPRRSTLRIQMRLASTSYDNECAAHQGKNDTPDSKVAEGVLSFNGLALVSRGLARARFRQLSKSMTR